MRRITLLLLLVMAASVHGEPVANYLKKTGTILNAKTGLKLVADSAGVAFGAVNLAGYKWVNLDMVAGWGRPISHYIYLDFPIQTATSGFFLFRDSAADIAAGDRDTVTVAGSVWQAGSLDSVNIAYKTSSDSGFIAFQVWGPDRSTAVGNCDSLYQTFTAPHTSSTITVSRNKLTNTITTQAGDMYAVRLIFDFRDDNEATWVAFVKLGYQ